jgi:N-acetylneuraminate synthase
MTLRKIRIGNRWVGEGEPCFIVAEAGSNHNGSLDQALAIIDAAKEAKADAVKFQSFRADKLYPRNAGTSDYLPVKKPIYDIIKSMEMPSEWIPILADHCKARALVFFSAPFDEESADELDPYVQVYKIASYEITHAPLIRHVAQKRKPMILSTGTADLAEVRQALEWCQAEGNAQVALLQCTASYPAPLSSLNIRALETMRETFGVPTGLSDHSRDPLIGPLAATALGANVIEKHFTLSNRLPGPDHAYALEPVEFATMVAAVRNVEQALGNGIKVMQSVERELRQFARRSIYAVCSIKKGEMLTADNVAVLRHGTLRVGVDPKYWNQVLGRKANRDIPEGSPIEANDCGIDVT